MADIVLEQVTKRYADGTEAVRAIDLEVADGEFLILVGPSGCGKSTALRMIAGLEEISEGTLRIGGEVVNALAPKQRDIAMVFQSYALYPHMTVRQNMSFSLQLNKVAKAEIERKVAEAASMLDLEQHLDRRPANLSGGQRQRVAMGRAIVRSPKAFLMDEPLSNLDAKLRVQMRTELARLQQRLGTTTIYVTHDQTEAMTLGDRVVVMKAGEVQQIGPPKELYDRPANLFVAGFMGSPPMNFLPAHLDGDVLRLPLGEVPLAGRLRWDDAQAPRAERLLAGVRPEHFADPRALDPARRGGGIAFDAKIDVVEALGAETYAYFSWEGEAPRAASLAELAEATDADEAPGDHARQVAVRLGAEWQPRAGERTPLWFDAAKLHLFDAQSGRCVART